MTQQIRLKVSSPSTGKVLFERYIPSVYSVGDIPYSTLIDALECLFRGIPHNIEFIVHTIDGY